MRYWSKILVTLLPVGLAACGGGESTETTAQGLTGQSATGSSDLEFTAWIGDTNTRLEFNGLLSGISLYSSTDSQCDLDNYSLCESSSYSTLSSDQSVLVPSVLDQRLSLWTQRNDVRGDRLILDSEQENSNSFTPGMVVSATSFKDRLWILTREEVDSEIVTSIGMPDTDIVDKFWSSAEGQSWRLEASTRDLANYDNWPYFRVVDDELIVVGAPEAGSLKTSDVSIVIKFVPPVSSDGDDGGVLQSSFSDSVDWGGILGNESLPFQQYDVIRAYGFADKLWIVTLDDSSVSVESNETIDIWMSADG